MAGAARQLRLVPNFPLVVEAIRSVEPDNLAEVEIGEQSRIAQELGLCSLGRLDLCFTLEQQFGISGRFADDPVWQGDPTVGEVLAAVTHATKL